MSTPTWKSPFKNKDLLRKDIENFLKKYNSFLPQKLSKIAIFFEITCYNYIIKFYRNSSYLVEPKNLDEKNGAFRYKLSPTGYPENFSYFLVKKTYRYRKNPKEFLYEVRHNIPIQSYHDPNIFVIPDIVICDGIFREKKDKRYYKGMRKLVFIPRDHVITFAEVKHYNPSPEMIFNFVGLVNELMPYLLKPIEKTYDKKLPKHLAPTLMISGKGNYHASLIRKSLQKRYIVNIILGLFSWPSQVYGRQHVNKLLTIKK